MEGSIELKHGQETTKNASIKYIERALLITGLPGSGKSLLADIAREMGINVVSMGEMIFKETIKRGLELTAENVSKIAKEVRERLGAGAVAYLTLREISNLHDTKSNQIIVIEGLRSIAEYNIFLKNFKKVSLIAVLASQEKRYKRLISRRRKDTEMDYWGLLLRDFREINFGIGDLIAIADHYLLNEGDNIEDFKNACRILLKNIINY